MNAKTQNENASPRPVEKIALDSDVYRAALFVAAELLRHVDEFVRTGREEKRAVAFDCFLVACQTIGLQFNKALYRATVDDPEYAAAHVAPGLFDAGIVVEFDARKVVDPGCFGDVKFERFTDLLAALDRIKAATPERVFVEIDAEIEVGEARGPFQGRFIGSYENGNYNLKRYGVEENGAREVLRCEFSRG